MKISDALLPEFDQEMATTRKVLARVPDGKWDWKPHAKSMAMGQLAAHVMGLVGWMIDTLKTPSYDVAPVDGPPAEFPKAANNKELLEKFEAFVAEGRAALAAAENAEMMAQWSLLQAGKPIFTLPRAAVLRSMIFNHLVHHRGQLTVYLRLNDIPVPSIYGPSADESF
jgi:uncharacterized damage-inducible protein DinB